MEIDEVFAFGKHKGETLDEVIVDDPGYVDWCLSEVDGFELDDEGMHLLSLSRRS